MAVNRLHLRRNGSVYLAVLGTALIVSMLALSALGLQRIQNRMLASSADIRQAELNAEAAIELGRLAMKQDANWRTTYSNSSWFTGRGTGKGTCTLSVTDPVDSDLSDSADDPVVMLGIGYAGTAQQRVTMTIDPRTTPLSCLRSAVAAGNAVSLTGCSLRASSGLISANSVSASTSNVYGSVEAVTISGSTYADTTTQIISSKRPTMPTWQTVFDYYKTNGAQLDINSLPTATSNNFGKNPNFANAPTSADWIGNAPGAGTATLVHLTNGEGYNSQNCVRVESRSSFQAGVEQRIDSFVEPGQQLTIQVYVQPTTGIFPKNFNVSICTKGTGGAAQTTTSSNTLVFVDVWTQLSVTLTVPTWTGSLEYAYFKIAGDSNNTGTFYVDTLVVREALTGRLIYQKALGPSYNNLYSGAPTNSQGIYWINCGGNKLVIERSRIRGTLLVINPGSGSCVGPGPIRWSPYVTGYPALLVDADTASDADFSILTSSYSLKESVDGVNYNPTGAPSDEFGTDTDETDIYPSEIQGLIAIEDDLTFQGNGLVRGQVVVGDNITATSGSLEIVNQPESLYKPPPGFTTNPTYVRRPASGKKSLQP